MSKSRRKQAKAQIWEEEIKALALKAGKLRQVKSVLSSEVDALKIEKESLSREIIGLRNTRRNVAAEITNLREQRYDLYIQSPASKPRVPTRKVPRLDPRNPRRRFSF